MKNYSRTKGNSNRAAYRTPSRVRVQKTLIAKLRMRSPQQVQSLQQSKQPYGA